MIRKIDARGFACPAPVLQTKDAVEKEHPSSIKVMVDNEASRQNVTRFLESQDFEVSVQQEGKDFRVIRDPGNRNHPQDTASSGRGSRRKRKRKSMSETDMKERRRISPDMTVLDVFHRYRQTEAVFKKYDEKVGTCICCQALFEPVRGVAGKYGLDLEQLIRDLEAAIYV